MAVREARPRRPGKILAQLSDLHIGFDRTTLPDDNFGRLERVLDRLCGGTDRPDLVLLTGDLADHGHEPNWSLLAAALDHADLPCWPIPGNHDDRGQLLRAFPHVRDAPGFADDEFIQYAIDVEGCGRILMLDTLEPGRHGAAFCARRANWLSEQLSARPDVPTLVAMHHPPFVTGIDWMDERRHEPWLARFDEAIKGHRQIIGITSGHIHRAVHSSWHGHHAMVCPSVAPAVALEFTKVDPERPDGRPLIVDEPPGYMLHLWHEGGLASHVLRANDHPVLARFDQRMQLVLDTIFAEHGIGRARRPETP